jgi:hypothetical protein
MELKAVESGNFHATSCETAKLITVTTRSWLRIFVIRPIMRIVHALREAKVYGVPF